ncbi:Holliday junction branch migration protein RuvA [Psittacicella gerlachiana]|uniref:Holliday junction branch migration complex subunit RuvA n=1 Tax=Psittacicella gerlachiana TaxID=2028574 RepID=A0A3A1YD27_9GAMM|nr:Holliday junction branch migration protein RuvA [Psittacicella gerlachiana]RIY35129.1 Holliday junction branch migration protein RuvA [Psittacicella gerlachiana]
MYGSLHGILLDKSTNTILIDCQGIGFEVTVPLTTFQRLPAVGNKVFLFVYQRVLEDAHQLFGFAHAIEKKIFQELIKLNKVGPKIALAVLGMYDFVSLLNIITNKDQKSLAAVPGIGKATAERMIVELNNRIEGIQEALALGKQQMKMLNKAYEQLNTQETSPAPIKLETVEEEVTSTFDFNELEFSAEVNMSQDPIRYSALQALTNLGLKDLQAQQLLEKVYRPELSLEQLIKACLDFYKGK